MMTGSGRSPRILLLTNNRIQPFTGGGVVLASLFHQVPADRMFILHSDPTETGRADYREYRLRDLRIEWPSLLRQVWRLVAAVLSAPLAVRKADLVNFVVQNCGYVVPKQVDTQIREFNPDLIYAWVGDSIWARLLDDCACRFGIPYVIHFMDNHVEITGETPLQRASQAEFRTILGRLASSAQRILTISPAMGVAYRGKFGKPFEVFHSLIDKSAWPWPAPSSHSSPFTIAFTGSVESGQLNGLRDVAKAVETLAGRGRDVELVLYLTEFYEQRARQSLKEFRRVEYRRHPPAEELRAALTNADMLVVAYGFDQPCIEYYRYSFATKVVPYMLSGRAILAYGPSTIEPIAYLRRGGWAHVVCEPGTEALADAIESLIDAPPRREQLARAAYDAGLHEHDLELNSQRFLATMIEVANSRRSA